MALALRRSLALRSAVAHLRRYLPPPSPHPPLETLSPPSPTPIRRPLTPPCRHFAAPPQVNKKGKEEDDESAGPRVNNAITAPFVRLVTDQGHDVVPRHEALQLAARMDMDLVEVHRKSDPPVCKIMDFHKEKYKKEVKEKELLKTKSAIVLRGGENKEVRFKGKTELKDLMVKADAITRLMERGSRVKCMAMPSGNEGEDLGEPLSRLLALIQDACIVESGPHLDSKHAYVIVRHVKFATKKGGKKASKWKMQEKVPAVLPLTHLLLVMIVKTRQLNVVRKLTKQLPISPEILPSKKKGRIEDLGGSCMGRN
uniref:Translation initiation factor 3 N-terminal domain-containing protein n=1 Tax=Arundo donax TaxID=35708 RepID=A0A0A8YBT6_ARUDO